MAKFKFPEYTCLWICNVDDVNLIDWICTRSKLIWQYVPNKCLNETRKTNNVAVRRRNHKIKNEIDVKITYFNKREREKRVTGVILGQKLTLNHSSLLNW